MLPVLEQSNDRTTLFYFYVAKLFLSYLFDDTAAAIAATIASKAYVGAATGVFVVPVFYTYDSLAHLALYEPIPLIIFVLQSLSLLRNKNEKSRFSSRFYKKK